MSTPEAVARAAALGYFPAMTDDTVPDWAETTEQRVLDAALPLAPQLGWNARLVEAAAQACGLSKADAALLLPNGPRDLAALLSRRHDRRALAALTGTDPAALKVRERIRRGVEARVEAAFADGEAVRRATLFLALPQNAPLALSLAWESADAIWRWAGDTATDENHYSKRALLAAILTSTLAVRFARGSAAAGEHLEARIGNVMAFEKWKAGLPRPAEALQRAAETLGRIRYGVSR